MKTTHAILGVLSFLAVPLSAGQVGHSVYYSVPTWSPDGHTIAFESNRDGEAAVYTIRPDGSGLTRLTPSGTLGEQPNWSPDGHHIVFTSSRDGVRQLYLMKRDGTDPVAIPATTNGFLAAYSADGRWLLFAGQDRPPSNHYRVFVMRPDGTGRMELGDGGVSNEDPRWTVDGRVVFTAVPLLEKLPTETGREFVRRRTEAQRSFVVAPGDRDARPLRPDEVEGLVRDRGLSPDGRYLVYSAEVDGVTGLYLREQTSGSVLKLDEG